jgi:hypothetical protein
MASADSGSRQRSMRGCGRIGNLLSPDRGWPCPSTRKPEHSRLDHASAIVVEQSDRWRTPCALPTRTWRRQTGDVRPHSGVWFTPEYGEATSGIRSPNCRSVVYPRERGNEFRRNRASGRSWFTHANVENINRRAISPSAGRGLPARTRKGRTSAATPEAVSGASWVPARTRKVGSDDSNSEVLKPMKHKTTGTSEQRVHIVNSAVPRTTGRSGRRWPKSN